MQVREVMTSDPACCLPDSSLQEVARLMVENDCGCIPVVKDKETMKPVGTITDRDITIRTVANGQNPVTMTASDAMSIDIATIKPNASLEECFKAMEEKDIRRILVADEQGKLCGIVAQADIVQKNFNPVTTTEFLREISEPSPSHNMTMSKNYESERSRSKTGTVLPILLGVGSLTAFVYYLGQRKLSTEEKTNQSTSEYQSFPVEQTSIHNFVDADLEVETRQRNLENRVQALKTGIQSVAEKAENTETSKGRFELKQSANGQYFFNLKASNGQVILSSEMYNSKSAAERGIESIKRNAADTNRFERKSGANNQSYFILKAGNGEEIGKSENYTSEAAMENGISSVMKNAPNAEITETAG
jgi:uncharacterized protein YegP (UPF0339 family)/CBS domain-containing protein